VGVQLGRPKLDKNKLAAHLVTFASLFWPDFWAQQRRASERANGADQFVCHVYGAFSLVARWWPTKRRPFVSVGRPVFSSPSLRAKATRTPLHARPKLKLKHQNQAPS